MDNKQYEEQLNWSKEQGLELDSRVERKAVNGLYGMYATEKIPQNTVIASYPFEKKIPIDTGVDYPKKSNFVFRYVHAAAVELEKGQSSKYHGCLMGLETMSELKQHSTYFYTQEDLKLLQKLNPILFRNITESIQSANINLKLVSEFDPSLNKDAILHVILNINSRAYGDFGFAPIMDSFNHSDRFGNLVSGLVKNGNSIGVQAYKGYEIGEQIFISYDRKDMYEHAISYNYFDPQGVHFIDYGARIIQTAKSTIEKQILQHTAKFHKLIAHEQNGVVQYTAKGEKLFFLENAPSSNLIDYIRHNCFQSEEELQSGKCMDVSFDDRVLDIINALVSMNKVDDFQLSDIPEKMHRFYHLLKKEKQMLLSNREWAMDNRNSLR